VTSAGSASTGRATLLCLRILSADVRTRRLISNKGKATFCDLSAEQIKRVPHGSFNRAPAHATAHGATASRRRPRSVRPACGLVEFATARRRCGRNRHVRRREPESARSVMYPIVHAQSYRTGDAWVIYRVRLGSRGSRIRRRGWTHSICTLEFENHRPLTIGSSKRSTRLHSDARSSSHDELELHVDEQAKAPELVRTRRWSAVRLGRSAHDDVSGLRTAVHRPRRSESSARHRRGASPTSASTVAQSSKRSAKDRSTPAPRVMSRAAATVARGHREISEHGAERDRRVNQSFTPRGRRRPEPGKGRPPGPYIEATTSERTREAVFASPRPEVRLRYALLREVAWAGEGSNQRATSPSFVARTTRARAAGDAPDGSKDKGADAALGSRRDAAAAEVRLYDTCSPSRPEEVEARA